MATQIGEVFTIRATLSEEEFNWRGRSTENSEWEDLLKRYEEEGDATNSSPSNLSFGIRLSSEPSPQVWLHVELEESYGQEVEERVEEKEEAFSLVLSGTSCPRDQLSALDEVMRRRLKESKNEGLDNRIFDVLSTLQSHLADHPLQIVEAEPQQKEEDGQARIGEKVLMARVIFWTHHLKAPSKRKDFASWTPELDLWGITKLGYPGFLCWEGAAPDVDEMVRRVKSLQWAALSLRSDVRWLYSKEGINVINNLEANSECYKTLVKPQLFREALKSCPLAKGHPGMRPYLKEDGSLKQDEGSFKTSLEEVESVKELVERFRSMGVPEQEFVDAFSLRTG